MLENSVLKKDFDLSSFCFDLDFENKDIFKFIENQNFFDNEVVKNVHYFFSKTQVIFFDNEKKLFCDKDDKCFDDICFEVCWNDHSLWSCHIAAPYYASQKKNWDCVFGFARQKLSQSHADNTFLHSFNCRDLNFIDVTTQADFHQELWWVDKKVLSKPRYNLNDFYSYQGVKIPKNILNDILFFYENEGITGNLWGYLKNNIFCSLEKTEEFIKIVNSDGVGWKYEPKDPI